MFPARAHAFGVTASWNPMNPSAPSSQAPSSTPPAAERLVSLDALRGFDMFWIIGADALFQALSRISDRPAAQALAKQLDHADWIGFRFYDLIFPLFVFIVGVSLVFSLTNLVVMHGKSAAIGRILRRSVMLYALAILFYGGFSHAWPDMRLMGVLNRIALCYLAAGLIFCFVRWKEIVVITIGLLVGYWALMMFVPFPDVRPTPGGTLTICKETGFTNVAQLNLESHVMLRGTMIKGVNLANYVDQKYLPGMKWDGTWDPEGLLSTLPAVANCLLGVLAGFLLRSGTLSNLRKGLGLLAGGFVCLALGYAWGLEFPIIKKIWTSSYVLVAGGCSAMLLALFYLVIDVLKIRFWCRPFVWIGMNPITVYLVNEVVDFQKLALRFTGGDVSAWLDTRWGTGFGPLVVATTGLSLAVLLCWFLHRKKLFLRV
jgi:predicted acyltransferase